MYAARAVSRDVSLLHCFNGRRTEGLCKGELCVRVGKSPLQGVAQNLRCLTWAVVGRRETKRATPWDRPGALLFRRAIDASQGEEGVFIQREKGYEAVLAVGRATL